VTVRRRVWIHRTATIICLLLAVPAVLWWKTSILFVILLSLSTQAWTSWSAGEAADDRAVLDRLAHLEQQLDALLEQRRRGHG
jgi:membrane protein implicated in regulation of membrane protease activity